MVVEGSLFLGGEETSGEGQAFFAREAATGKNIAPVVHEPSKEQIREACRRAAEATHDYAETPPERRSMFLSSIADMLESTGNDLVARCMLETGLPRTRLENELVRTTHQLRMFAEIAKSGRYQALDVEASRTPGASAPLLQKYVTVGPVAVFGASNFPLAFSVAGGDTASALAAGCPVVVKGHAGHPGASEIVARVICEASRSCGIPAGVFSLLTGPSDYIGAALVTDPCISAVAFTGSRRGGLALTRLAQGRPLPIPVFAEMGSINPVILLPAALEEDADGIARRYVSALTLGAGQFCTNPGILFAVASEAFDGFKRAASDAIAASAPQVMLTPEIAASYAAGVKRLALDPAVRVLAQGVPGNLFQCQASLGLVHVRDFISNPLFHHEVFGPASLMVVCDDLDQLLDGIRSLEGQLAASMFVAPGDEELARHLLGLLGRKAGRLIVNDFATGVEVNRVMVHGGPYPATTDSRTTSVGALAIERFLRPICVQGLHPSSDLLRSQRG